MKIFLKSVLVLTSLLMITMTSCQSEENETITDDNANLKKTSVLTNLLSRVAQDSTSVDNVIDSTSCFSVNLPVTVIVNNEQVTISDATGYAVVQNILNEFDDDDDTVFFVFPITITFANYTTSVINNADQLDDIIEDCGEDNDLDEIECLNINYPITISYYNTGTQTPSTVTINSDADLYNFFEDFDDDDYATINYPISVTNANGNQIIINNNSELEAEIENAEASCEGQGDDDDDDFDDDEDNDDDNSPIATMFLTNIQTGTWRVTYFFDTTNKTANYQGYNFTFNPNGTIAVSSGNATFSGQWEAYVDDNEDTLEIEFSSSQLEKLSDDWEIIEYSETQIRMKDVSGGNGETDFLTLTRN
ncbi:hypothetical protein [Flavobacterium sp.]|uniref:hypothetical protein n=1 Tax=Flavobacterium sp. TaxID=239 RepID=UPI0026343082|nr:hypothetical protein [Flavobacterium sp.]MDD3005353.1 hypothetical protein [Flavobacterium sp.]